MKKYSWIVALLMALSLAFVFVGCGGGGGDDPPDPNLPEVELSGEDIVLAVIGDGTVDKNTYALNKTGPTNAGFSIDFPEDVKGKSYWKVGVEIEIVEITSPAFVSFNGKTDRQIGTDVLIVGHTKQYHNELKIGTVTDKEVSAKCDDDVCTQYEAGTTIVGAKGYAEYPFNKFTTGLIAFQYNPWAGDIPGKPAAANVVADFKVKVNKLVFIPAEGAVPDVTVYEEVISGVAPPATGGTPVTEITATEQYTGTVAWTPAVTTVFADATDYTATITLTAAEGYTFKGVEEDFFTVAGATTVSNAADSGVVTAVFPKTSAPATSLTITVDGVAKQTTSLTGNAAIVKLLNDGSGYTLDVDTTASDNAYDHTYAILKVDLGAAVSTFTKITFNVTGTTYKEIWVKAGKDPISGYQGGGAEATLKANANNDLAGGPGVDLAIDNTEALKVTGTDIYIAINVRIGASDGPITVSDIKFVK